MSGISILKFIQIHSVTDEVVVYVLVLVQLVLVVILVVDVDCFDGGFDVLLWSVL